MTDSVVDHEARRQAAAAHLAASEMLGKVNVMATRLDDHLEQCREERGETRAALVKLDRDTNGGIRRIHERLDEQARQGTKLLNAILLLLITALGSIAATVIWWLVTKAGAV